MKVSIKDVAKAAGVSTTTVSLSFVEKSRISSETRKRVLSVARQLNYLPNQSARNLRLGGSSAIGFIINDIENPFYTHMVRMAEAIAALSGYQMIVAESNWDAEKEVEAVRNMIQSQIRGILICSCEQTKESFRLIDDFRLPCIAVDTFPAFYRGAYVINNLAKTGQIAADVLISAGCKNLAILSGKPELKDYSSFQQMEKGFSDRCKDSGIEYARKNTIYAGLTVEEGRNAFTNFLESKKKIDGVFCLSDLCAIGAIEAAEKKGLVVGRDLAIIGVDNLDISGIERISLTSVSEPNDEIINLATAALVESIKMQKRPEIKSVLDPTLVERESSKLSTSSK